MLRLLFTADVSGIEAQSENAHQKCGRSCDLSELRGDLYEAGQRRQSEALRQQQAEQQTQRSLAHIFIASSLIAVQLGSQQGVGRKGRAQ